MGAVLFTANFGLSNLQAPASGVTHGVKLSVTINNETLKFPLDSVAQTIGDFNAQAMLFDNTQGTAAVVISETTFGWSRTVNAGVGVVFQFPAVPHPVFTVSTTGSATAATWVLYDWPAFPDTWTNTGNPAGGAAVTITGQPISVDVLAGPPATQAGYQAGAATAIVTGGVAVVVFAAGVLHKQGFIKNPDAATETLYVDFVNLAQVAEPGTHGTCFALAPGASFTFGPAAVPSGAISVNAATAGHAFVAVGG